MGKIDTMTKQYISNNDRFADICNFYLFDGKRVINPDNLEEQDVTELGVVFSEDEITPVQKLRDVLKTAVAKSAGGVTYIIVGVENQSDIHYAMCIKNMMYDALNYAGQVEKPRTLHEMLEVNNAGILDYVQDYKLNLIVPDEIKDFGKFNTELKKMMEFVSCSNDADRMNRFIENHHNDRVISQEGARLLNECFGANIEIIQEEADVEMCEGIKGYGLIKKAEGIREGMCEGKREGIHEGKIQTLLELVIEGELSVETAARKAQMSVEEFQGLLAVNNN